MAVLDCKKRYLPFPDYYNRKSSLEDLKYIPYITIDVIRIHLCGYLIFDHKMFDRSFNDFESILMIKRGCNMQRRV